MTCKNCGKKLTWPEQIVSERENDGLCSKCRWETKNKFKVKGVKK
jgi:hypothetical protein